MAFMMLDDNLVAASPASFYRVLKKAGLLDQHNRKPSKKGTGFVQPLRLHEHWHVDVAYINISGSLRPGPIHYLFRFSPFTKVLPAMPRSTLLKPWKSASKMDPPRHRIGAHPGLGDHGWG